jgi:hypothetical protein
MVDKPVSLAEKEVGYTEALATWMTRYEDVSGFQCQLSLEAETGAEVLNKAEAAVAYLTESKCFPLHLGNHNGNGHGNNDSSDATIEVKKEGGLKNPLCPIHHVEMKLWTKGNRSWYSHRWEGGWCRGEVR